MKCNFLFHDVLMILFSFQGIVSSRCQHQQKTIFKSHDIRRITGNFIHPAGSFYLLFMSSSDNNVICVYIVCQMFYLNRRAIHNSCATLSKPKKLHALVEWKVSLEISGF